MPTPLDDEITQALAVQYVLGELDADAAAAFDRRCATDDALAAEVRRLRASFDAIGRGELRAPRPGLRDRVLAAAAEQHARRQAERGAEAATTPGAPTASTQTATPSQPTTTTAPPRGPTPAKVVPLQRPERRVVWSRFAAAAAAAVALAFGVDAWRTRQELALQRDLSIALLEPNVVRTFQLAGAGGAWGKVALDLDAKRGAVALKKMPALPAGQVYRLWAQVGDNSVHCGDFGVDASGTALATIRVPVEAYTAPIGQLFVTVEPAGPPSTPHGAHVVASV